MNTSTTNELWRRSAREVVDLLGSGAISPLEAIDAAEQRITQVEPHLNALPTLCFERARAHARIVSLDVV